MKIAVVQNEVDENIEVNLKRLQTSFEKINQNNTDIAVLGELFSVPYNNDEIKKACVYQENTLALLKKLAKEKGIWIIGGTIPYKAGGHIFNRCFIINRQGQITAKYDKTHLMRMNGHKHHYDEADVFTPGDAFITFDTEFGKMGVLICYDIRFPRAASYLRDLGIKSLFVPASFNASVGPLHWMPLLETRAMENEYFVIGASNAKYDYKNFHGYGHSAIINPFGKPVLKMGEKPDVGFIEIDLNEVEKIRYQMPLLSRQRKDLYEN